MRCFLQVIDHEYGAGPTVDSVLAEESAVHVNAVDGTSFIRGDMHIGAFGERKAIVTSPNNASSVRVVSGISAEQAQGRIVKTLVVAPPVPNGAKTCSPHPAWQLVYQLSKD